MGRNDATTTRLDATLAFDAPVGRVRAVSGQRAAALAAMGIRTVRDLLTHFPRRYVDMSQVAQVATVPIGATCTILGTVHKAELKRPKPRLNLTEVTVVDGTGTLIVTCFRQPWLADRLKPGMRLAVSGKVEFNYGFKRMTNPFLEEVDVPGAAGGGVIVAVHPASEKVSTAWMRRFIANALELVRGLDDPLPLELRTRYRLVSRGRALEGIHFPVSMDEQKAARRRLTYEEVLLLELHLMREGAARDAGAEPCAHTVDGPRVGALEASLPFELTDEQKAARDELLAVMAAPRPAHHMLLGDVGTGKTAVAAFGLAAAADSGGQALMMAPTEVLAEQHARALGTLLDAAQVRWALLTGSTPADERAEVLDRLAAGGLQVLFGTHALLEDDVRPARCTFVCIDEQQRFGVDQRARLIAKGPGCDCLSMTATPIPRTLALALYGDMTLSYLHARPHAHAGTATHVFARTQRGAAYEIAREALDAGRQVFVVCPLVGEAAQDEKARKKGGGDEERDDYDFGGIAFEDEADLEGRGDARAALQEAGFLRDKIFCGYEVGVLHGRMKPAEKRDVMQRFREGQTHVLVSTTVIEVGVDVPNATVMIVEDADRFGLAQLHQLRGRVGRGEHAGQMCLVSGSKAPAALARLQAMERTEDGFELAEHDLSLRREGDILGNRQHGAGALKLVNVVRDAKVIEAAHADAAAILAVDPDLSAPGHAALRAEVARLFPQQARKD